MSYSSPSNYRISNCKTCGEKVLWRFLELFEKEHQNQTLQWRRILIRQLGWTAFDVDNPGLIHEHAKPRLGKKSEAMAA